MPSKRKLSKKQLPQQWSSPAGTSVAAILPQAPSVGQKAATRTDFWLLLDMDPTDEESPQQAAPSQPQNDTASSAILATIEASMSMLMGHIDAVNIECGLIQQDLHKIRGCLSTAESYISEAEDTTATIQHDVSDLLTQSENTENRLS